MGRAEKGLNESGGQIIGRGSDVKNTGYLCARSVSLLLRLYPIVCTKEEKYSPFYTNWHLLSPQRTRTVIRTTAAYLYVFLLIGICVHKNAQASEVVLISKNRPWKRIYRQSAGNI